ncbi:hypothetical protein WAI453_006440 [Rhynchosporium graminicola]
MSSSKFRRIKPSCGQTSAAASDPSQSTFEGTGSDGRRPRTDKDIPAQSSSPSSKRRKVPDSVTPNACLHCKKARTKCDGNTPCKRCATRVETSACTYEVHIKHTKGELVKQINELRAKDRMTEQILQALSTNEKVPEILKRLSNGEAYSSIVEWLGRSPLVDLEPFSSKESRKSTYAASDHEMGGIGVPFWTKVTTDTSILDHLFQLYFAWVHPIHTLFSEARFADSYGRKTETHCSSVLVDSVCALACCLHTAVDGEEEGIYKRLGARFSDAARKALEPDDSRLTTIQAFAVMHLVDCAHGNALRAVAYLKVATISLPRAASQEVDGFVESWKATFGGIRNLNIEWAQMTFQPPPILESAVYNSTEEADDILDNKNWYPYRFSKEQPDARWSLLATTNREKSKLNAILQDIAMMIYAQRGISISARQFLFQYGRLRTWREQLPDVLSSFEDGNEKVLPHVLYLLVYHSTAIVQLLRPLLDLEGFPSTLVEGAIWEHAQEGLRLLDKYYRRQYTFRYQPFLQMLASLQLIDIIARFFPEGTQESSKNGAEAIEFGMTLLMESRIGFPVARPLQEMLRRSAVECAILLPRNLEELMFSPTSPKRVYDLDDFIGACTSPKYIQPVFEAHSKYSASFSSDWIIERTAYDFPKSTFGVCRLTFPCAKGEVLRV